MEKKNTEKIASERVSGASEGAKGHASGLVLQSGFLVILAQSVVSFNLAALPFHF